MKGMKMTLTTDRGPTTGCSQSPINPALADPGVRPCSIKEITTMKILPIVLLVALCLTACNDFIPKDKYQIATSTDGNVYRLDKSSGEVWLIKNNTMEKLQAKDLRLQIGQRYVGEDLYSFTYLGKGQVGEMKTLDDFRLDKKKNDPLGIR
jgi:hypothetical protein